ncbi:MAG: hypothetical protein KF734_06565 [Saprospiraceae bacterium]|nr:hypothetical protein [Saprospiraceae bacterium]
MKLIHVLPAAGLLFSAAMSLDKMAPSPLILPEAPVAESAPKMWASSTVIYKGELLKLYFKAPNPRYLGVIDPNGRFFYVVFPKEEGAGKLKPFVSSERFETMKMLKINTATFKADPYTYGIVENRPVFTKSGTYQFLLGDNLHVDDESAITILKVKYKHSARPLPTNDIAALD